jgi:hypothetical protein
VEADKLEMDPAIDDGKPGRLEVDATRCEVKALGCDVEAAGPDADSAVLYMELVRCNLEPVHREADPAGAGVIAANSEVEPVALQV